MIPLFLDGVAFVGVKDGALTIKGKSPDKSFQLGRFEETIEREHSKGGRPDEVIKYDCIIAPRGYGQISMGAIWWLSQHNIPIYWVDLNGDVYSELLPNQTQFHGSVRLGQYEIHAHDKKRGDYITKQILEKKVETQFANLKSMGQTISTSEIVNISRHEGRLANYYFSKIRQVLLANPKSAWAGKKFVARRGLHQKGNQHAVDPFNVVLNLNAKLLEGQITRLLISFGADPCIGFAHGEGDKHKQRPLTYDVMELGRFIAEKTAVELFTEGILSQEDFMIGKGLTVLLTQEASRKVIKKFAENFSNYYLPIRQTVSRLCEFFSGDSKVFEPIATPVKRWVGEDRRRALNNQKHPVLEVFA
jgi:CRISPR-associated protein Cas1